MQSAIKSGVVVGNGAAINVSLGFVPAFVFLFNATDGDLVTFWHSTKVIPFTSGGVAEVVAGDKLVGATSGATAIVDQVLLMSGTFAGGDAAGFFVVRADDVTGTMGSENVDVSGKQDNIATVTAVVDHSGAIAAAAAAATGNAALSAYAGTSTAAAGFTIGSTVSENDKLLKYVAFRETF